MTDTSTHLIFNLEIGKHKPENIINTAAHCPFCDRSNLTDIIEKRGSIWLVKNKYPVLEDTLQTVIIETEYCHSELSLYPKKHLHNVIAFGLEKWLEMINSRQFVSVIFYKNHGPYSGGTIRHPHMQIVGLKKLNCLDHIRPESFAGELISRQGGVELNLSTHPRMGFFEFNVILEDLAHQETLADYIQIGAHYILNKFHHACKSYNLFFYHWHGKIVTKIIPRFVTSPLFIGYSIPQVANHERRCQVIQQIKDSYF